MEQTALKEDLIQMIEKMPDNITISDVMEELYLRLEIQRAEQEIEEGKSLSHEVVKNEVEKWLTR